MDESSSIATTESWDNLDQQEPEQELDQKKDTITARNWMWVSSVQIDEHVIYNDLHAPSVHLHTNPESGARTLIGIVRLQVNPPYERCIGALATYTQPVRCTQATRDALAARGGRDLNIKITHCRAVKKGEADEWVKHIFYGHDLLYQSVARLAGTMNYGWNFRWTENNSNSNSNQLEVVRIVGVPRSSSSTSGSTPTTSGAIDESSIKSIEQKKEAKKRKRRERGTPNTRAIDEWFDTYKKKKGVVDAPKKPTYEMYRAAVAVDLGPSMIFMERYLRAQYNLWQFDSSTRDAHAASSDYYCQGNCCYRCRNYVAPPIE